MNRYLLYNLLILNFEKQYSLFSQALTEKGLNQIVKHWRLLKDSATPITCTLNKLLSN